jgi:hypothetical protein
MQKSFKPTATTVWDGITISKTPTKSVIPDKVQMGADAAARAGNALMGTGFPTAKSSTAK